MKPEDAVPLSILIVTYNSSALIGTLLARLRPEVQAIGAEVIVVDNASHDGTAEDVAADHPWVRLVASRVNLGFAAGNNLGARHANGRFLLLLNPDAVPEPGAIALGVDLMQRYPEVGLAGGLLIGADGSLQPSARSFPSLLSELFVLSGLAARWPRSRLFGRFDRTWADPYRSAEVDWVPGAFAFVARDLWERLGGFDERYFLYYEEVDLCRRIGARGLKVQYWPQLRVRHVGGASARTVAGGQVSSSGSQLTLWRARAGLLYYRKMHGLPAAWAVNQLERGWHAVRALKARLAGRVDRSAESLAHAALLARAWNDTLGGRVSPPRPW